MSLRPPGFKMNKILESLVYPEIRQMHLEYTKSTISSFSSDQLNQSQFV